jgi:hypothetical protein
MSAFSGMSPMNVFGGRDPGDEVETSLTGKPVLLVI